MSKPNLDAKDVKTDQKKPERLCCFLNCSECGKRIQVSNIEDPVLSNRAYGNAKSGPRCVKHSKGLSFYVHKFDAKQAVKPREERSLSPPANRSGVRRSSSRSRSPGRVKEDKPESDLEATADPGEYDEPSVIFGLARVPDADDEDHHTVTDYNNTLCAVHDTEIELRKAVKTLVAESVRTGASRTATGKYMLLHAVAATRELRTCHETYMDHMSDDQRGDYLDVAERIGMLIEEIEEHVDTFEKSGVDVKKDVWAPDKVVLSKFELPVVGENTTEEQKKLIETVHTAKEELRALAKAEVKIHRTAGGLSVFEAAKAVGHSVAMQNYYAAMADVGNNEADVDFGILITELTEMVFSADAALP